MNAAEKLVSLFGQTLKTTLYESVVGKIEIENEILIDGSVSTTLWVIYPDGMGDEVTTIDEAMEKLEL